MGGRGIRFVVGEYLRETPLYLTYYDKAADALRGVVDLPARRSTQAPGEAMVARRLLLRIGPVAVPELIRRTHSREAGVRGRAATLLGELGLENTAAQRRLTELLSDTSTEVVYRSLEVLWMTLPEHGAAVGAIVPFLSHTNLRVRVEASYALGCLQPIPKPTLEPLLNLLSDPHATPRANAARAIGLTGERSDRILTLLEAQLSDVSQVARFRAAEALARLYGSELSDRNDLALQVMVEAEASRDHYFRLIAFNGWIALGGGDGPRSALPATFREALSNPQTYVRSDAIESLEFYARTHETALPPEFMSLLVAALEDQNGVIRYRAAAVLENLDLQHENAVPASNRTERNVFRDQIEVSEEIRDSSRWNR